MYKKNIHAIEVGENIKSARRAKGFTQKEMADKLFMTQQQYSAYENGVYEFGYAQTKEVCKILDITPNEMFGIGY